MRARSTVTLSSLSSHPCYSQKSVWGSLSHTSVSKKAEISDFHFTSHIAHIFRFRIAHAVHMSYHMIYACCWGCWGSGGRRESTSACNVWCVVDLFWCVVGLFWDIVGLFCHLILTRVWHTSGMLVLVGLFWYMIGLSWYVWGLFWHVTRDSYLRHTLRFAGGPESEFNRTPYEHRYLCMYRRKYLYPCALTLRVTHSAEFQLNATYMEILSSIEHHSRV